MDFFLKCWLVVLLFGTVLGFAGTEPWAFSLVQAGVLAGVCLCLFSRRHIALTPVCKWAGALLLFLAAYALLQSLFPFTLLEPRPAHPAALVPLYAREHASFFITYLAVVVLTCQAAGRAPQVRQLMLAAGLCGMLVAAIALIFPAGSYIDFFTGRRGGFGPFLNRNHAGVFLAMCTVLLSGSLLSWRAQRTEKTRPFEVLQVAGWLLVAVLGIACICTRSRGGMLALGVGLFLYSGLLAFYLPKTARRKVLFLGIWVVLLGLTLYWVQTHVELINAFSHRSSGASVETRKMLYLAAWRLLGCYPYFGIGIGAMPVALPSFMPRQLASYVERLHNDWLELLLGMGYVGFAVLLAAVGWFGWQLLKRLGRVEPYKQMLLAGLTSTLAAMSVASVVDFHFSIPANALLFFMVLGMAASPSFDKPRMQVFLLTPLRRGVAVLVLCAALWIPLEKTRAWRLFLFGRNLRTENRLAYYEKALTLYPSPRFAVRLGNAYYNAHLHTQDPGQREVYLLQALTVAENYLSQYPKDKELSRLYVRVQAALARL